MPPQAPPRALRALLGTRAKGALAWTQYGTSALVEGTLQVGWPRAHLALRGSFQAHKGAMLFALQPVQLGAGVQLGAATAITPAPAATTALWALPPCFHALRLPARAAMPGSLLQAWPLAPQAPFALEAHPPLLYAAQTLPCARARGFLPSRLPASGLWQRLLMKLMEFATHMEYRLIELVGTST